MPQSKLSHAATLPTPAGVVHRPRGNRVPPLSHSQTSKSVRKHAGLLNGQGSSTPQGPLTGSRAPPQGERPAYKRTVHWGSHNPSGVQDSTRRSEGEDGSASTKPVACVDSVVVTRPERDLPCFHLAVQALQEGCIQSFIRFFYLSHRDPVCVNELSQKHFTIPEGKLAWVQQKLSAVEVLRRQSEFRDVLNACSELAGYFESEGDLVEAAWHHERALRYMTESLDVPLEQTARENYASFLQRCGKLEASAEQYEIMYRLAKAVKDEEKALVVSFSLVTLYQMLGERELAAGNFQTARNYFERCAVRAQRSRYSVEEGSAYEALGYLHEKKGQLYTALEYQKNFRIVSHRDQLFEKECQAIMNVASLEDRIGDNNQAITSLQEAASMARELGDAVKIAKATMHLGEAYRSKLREEIGDKDSQGYGNTSTEIMVRFAESFEAARQSGDMELIDSARVLLGFARGSHYFKHAGNDRGYPDIVCNDVRAQLKWMSTGEL
ncbi:unnamed protein product [Phytomonas sp. EM1]|nr:unnamed protein product [Phytomonas sp. EM1]|eukprot:CCW64341.1 unnamed protein product [Phytomonas sp. isolate EM1]